MKTVCERFGVESVPPSTHSIVGLARRTVGNQPINGLRHPATGTSNGWYLWAGDWSDADDFFEPFHIEHVGDYFPHAVPYLNLPVGYRFLVDRDGNEDVWFDDTLLKHE